MAIWDWFFARETAKRDAFTKRRSPKRFSVEPLENRTNLALTPLPTFEAPYSASPVLDPTVSEAPAQAVGGQLQAFESIQTAQATTQYVVDSYKSLLYELQQEVSNLADLPPLDPADLIQLTEVELDSAIDGISNTDQQSAEHWSEARSQVRQLEITLDEITSTVGELAEAKAQNEGLLQEIGELRSNRRT